MTVKRIDQVMNKTKDIPYDPKSGEINLYYIIRRRGKK